MSSSQPGAEHDVRWTKAREEYDAHWAIWGGRLLREHPDGLGPEPDFSKDGDARFVWSVEGFLRHQEAAWIFGEFKTCRIGEKEYTHHPAESVEDQIYIAKKAFAEAGAYWFLAKQDADQRKAEEQRAAAAAKAQEDELDALSREVTAADTIQQLEIKATEIRDRLRGEANDKTVFLHRQLSVIHTRLIELERQNARSNWRWAVAGFVVGAIGIIVGIVFPVWDLTHRAAEPAHQTQQKPIAEDTIE